MKRIILLILVSILLAACAPAQTPASATQPARGTETATAAARETVGGATASASATRPNVSPTPDLRLDPEKWQDWPVVPQVSARAREIYARGLALGNDPHAFSKIGDCQSIPASFLGLYDTDRYTFAPEFQYLQETVDFYAGSFEREGESVRGGFNAATVLLPLWAMSSEACQSGENPMQCENRIHNPSLVFISLEVWFEGRTPDVYEKYLRQIIEFNIEQGTLPILATKADNVEGDHSINAAVAKLAHEYDLPLWNYWHAVQPLPNHGLDVTDPTGFHLNLDGWNMRSFSALQTLDAVRRGMEDVTADGTALAPTQSTSAAPSASFTPGPVAGLPFSSVVANPSPDPAPPSLLLGFSIRNGNRIESAGIFAGTLSGQNWSALAESGLTLLDYSDAGLLAAQGQNLYLLKDLQRALITDQLISETGQPAILLADGRVAAILQTESGNQLVIFTEGAPQIIPTESAPQSLHPSLDPNYLYWGAGDPVENFFSTSLTDLASTALPYTGRPAFASDGKMAFMDRDAEGKNQLALVDGAETKTIPFYGNRLVHMQWSPDATTLAVSVSQVSDYSGLVLRSRLYFVKWPINTDQVAEFAEETIEQHIWSPDGKSLLLVTRKFEGGEYRLDFSVLDAITQVKTPALGFQLVTDEYLSLQPLFWLP